MDAVADKLNLPDVKPRCMDIMVSNFTEVSQLKDFMSMSDAEVQDYFGAVIGSDIHSDGILNGIMRWISHDAENRLIHLEDQLKQVELSNCSVQGIADVMRTYKTLVVSNMDVFTMLMDAIKENSAKQEKKQLPKAKPSGEYELVVVGGNVDSDVNRECYRLDQSKQMAKLCDIPYDLKKRHSVCKTSQGFVITGGEGSDLCVMYIAATKSWVRLENMRNQRYCDGSICAKDVLYVLGGWSSDCKDNSVHYLALEGGSWQLGPSLPNVIIWPKVTNVNDNVYVLDTGSSDFLQLNFDRSIWIKQAPFPCQCTGTSVTSTNGQVVVAGGLDKRCGWCNPATNAWSMGQQTLHSHTYGSFVPYDKKLLLLGGFDTVAIEELSIEDGSWSVSDIKMPAQLMNHVSLVLDIPED